MMNVTIENGAIFYGKTCNHLNIEFDGSLKEETFTLARKFHKLIDSRETQNPEYSKKYDNCSFKELRLPEIFARQKSVKILKRSCE
jgi:CRISPR-associated exonuclease Cas4